jgi:hypothetical protein
MGFNFIFTVDAKCNTTQLFFTINATMIAIVDDKSGNTVISMKIHDYNTRLVGGFINHIFTVSSVCLKQLKTEAP